MQIQKTEKPQNDGALNFNESKGERNYGGVYTSAESEEKNKVPDMEQFGTEHFSFENMDSMDNTWFMQQLNDLDWLNFS
jgi:hypothetical protein